jgi:N-acetyl-anhydromuramyl-L-alanine amidase AmpD
MAAPRALSGAVQDSAGAVRDIQHAHMNVQSYGDIGYHFLIDPYGRVFEGRQLSWQGAHAGGQNNVENIGVCVIGNFERERPTRAALASLDRLVDELSQTYAIDERNVVPHSHWKNTACPGRNLESWLSQRP